MEENTIFVKNYETLCLIGIYPKEKGQQQKIRVSVKLGLKKVGKKDILKSTVSYEHIFDYLNNIKRFSHINLVETLAQKMAVHFLKFKNVNLVEIEIIKLKILDKKTDVGFLLKKSIK